MLSQNIAQQESWLGVNSWEEMYLLNTYETDKHTERHGIADPNVVALFQILQFNRIIQ